MSKQCIRYIASFTAFINVFNCSHNQLKTLPETPKSLIRLECQFNQLVILSNLSGLTNTLILNPN